MTVYTLHLVIMSLPVYLLLLTLPQCHKLVQDPKSAVLKMSHGLDFSENWRYSERPEEIQTDIRGQPPLSPAQSYTERDERHQA